MSESRLHIFAWGLVAATFFALLSAFGAGEARAGDCSANNFVFNLGGFNTCNTTTSLNTIGAGIGVDVFTLTPGNTALEGDARATTGAGTGVYGSTSSTSASTDGVAGVLWADHAGHKLGRDIRPQLQR
jgi:hypothetical protein